jgi:hypothetical protein
MSESDLLRCLQLEFKPVLHPRSISYSPFPVAKSCLSIGTVPGSKVKSIFVMEKHRCSKLTQCFNGSL